MRISGLIVLLALASATHAEEVNFNRDIQSILSQNCFQCHGPDDATRAAGLRLDQADSATKPAESGATAIVAADPEHSELLARITSVDPELHMPPAETRKILTGERMTISWLDHARYADSNGFQTDTSRDLWACLAPDGRTPPEAQQLETYFRENVDNPFRNGRGGIEGCPGKTRHMDGNRECAVKSG